MSSLDLKLEQLLDLPKWQSLQDALAESSGLAMITVDYKGQPITRHSGCIPFCAAIRSNAHLSKVCQKCDSRGGLEAVRLDAPYIYLCHYRIVDLAIPIHVANKYVGCVLAGQVKIADPENAELLEQILLPTYKTPEDDPHLTPELRTAYAQIAHVPYASIKSYAHMLFQLCHYIVEEAIHKYFLADSYEQIFQISQASAISPDKAAMQTREIEQIKRRLSGMVTQAYIQDNACPPELAQHPALKKAYAYVNENKGAKISLNEAAARCHLSASYFSRLFQKETGVSFSLYVSRQRIEWAKQLLEKTELSIEQIAEAVGFSDATYFIKAFKKQDGLTPALYRKYRRPARIAEKT